jgi:hypothetical protein
MPVLPDLASGYLAAAPVDEPFYDSLTARLAERFSGSKKSSFAANRRRTLQSAICVAA